LPTNPVAPRCCCRGGGTIYASLRIFRQIRVQAGIYYLANRCCYAASSTGCGKS